MRAKQLALAAGVLGALALSACETTEGYRQKMSTWQGRTGDELMIEWGAPNSKTTLSDGREMWTYDKHIVNTTPGYYHDETREKKRIVRDRDGQEREEKYTETFPVWTPPVTQHTQCATRFVLSTAHRIEQVAFDGTACVAPESKGN